PKVGAYPPPRLARPEIDLPTIPGAEPVSSRGPRPAGGYDLPSSARPSGQDRADRGWGGGWPVYGGGHTLALARRSGAEPLKTNRLRSPRGPVRLPVRSARQRDRNAIPLVHVDPHTSELRMKGTRPNDRS